MNELSTRDILVCPRYSTGDENRNRQECLSHEYKMTERKDDRLWGGRFEREPNKQFDAFQRSFAFDRRLLPHEIAVDRAWAKALQPVGVFTGAEVKQTLSALDKISDRAKTDSAWLESFGATAEDVHHFVEKALVEELGPLGWKLHTGRSRNELVSTDFRLFVIDAVSEVQHGIEALLNSFLFQAKANLSVPMAGMTHMQHAQPILLSHFLLAHAEAFTRDITRLQHAAASADACPMGSVALAGNSFVIDRSTIARELGFSRITLNSLDAVSDRDFALDYIFALPGIATHLSRLAEDFVIFASQEFSYVILPDEFSTGSSLMPQKKNPDAWELIRGKTGRITGALVSLVTTLKGLPTSYQRDLQEDKEALFAAHDQVADMLGVAAGAAEPAQDGRQQHSNDPSPLLRRIGGPFRERRASHPEVPLMKHALSEAALPLGFRFAATACGLKKTGALDLAILSSDVPASAAAVFTQNLVVAAPVLISKEHLRISKGRMRAVVVNAGNANCATGEAGHTAALREVAGRTFNAISVDGDTSTNDTLLVLANGEAGAPSIKAGTSAHRAFAAALEDVCHSLALQIVADGEGAQRVIEIEVRGAKTEAAAKRIAGTIATSPLVKTAFAGGDPNWGRIFAAAGRSGVKFDTALVDIKMAGISVLRRGQPLDFNERAASNKLLTEHVPLVVDLHAGKARARYWTCDFTAEYVRINASYRT